MVQPLWSQFRAPIPACTYITPLSRYCLFPPSLVWLDSNRLLDGFRWLRDLKCLYFSFLCVQSILIRTVKIYASISLLPNMLNPDKRILVSLRIFLRYSSKPVQFVFNKYVLWNILSASRGQCHLAAGELPRPLHYGKKEQFSPDLRECNSLKTPLLDTVPV
jgi:hypothetical protein